MQKKLQKDFTFEANIKATKLILQESLSSGTSPKDHISNTDTTDNP